MRDQGSGNRESENDGIRYLERVAGVTMLASCYLCVTCNTFYLIPDYPIPDSLIP